MDMTTVAVGLGLFATLLSAASLILHTLAPMTDTKVDDKAADVVDFLKDKVVPMAQAVLPEDKSKPSAKVTGFEPKAGATPGQVRDHRSGK